MAKNWPILLVLILSATVMPLSQTVTPGTRALGSFSTELTSASNRYCAETVSVARISSVKLTAVKRSLEVFRETVSTVQFRKLISEQKVENWNKRMRD